MRVVLERRFHVRQIGQVLGQTGVTENPPELLVIAAADFQSPHETFFKATLVSQSFAGPPDGIGVAGFLGNIPKQFFFIGIQRQTRCHFVLQGVQSGFPVVKAFLNISFLSCCQDVAYLSRQVKNIVNDVHMHLVMNGKLRTAPF